MGRALILSPHLDDAVLSAGRFIDGHHSPRVATLCTGGPPGSTLTEYDEHCGFNSSSEAMMTRTLEDAEAMRILGGVSLHAGLLDDQYGGSTVSAHIKALESSVRWASEGGEDLDMILAPLATRHPDHVKVMRAALAFWGMRTEIPLFLYEELPHRVLWPEEVFSRIEELRKDGLELELEFIGDGSNDRRDAAVREYKSQLWALDLRAALAPERFHRVTST